jgi:WD40 repeat protein/serine/threonine protein kinase
MGALVAEHLSSCADCQNRSRELDGDETLRQLYHDHTYLPQVAEEESLTVLKQDLQIQIAATSEENGCWPPQTGRTDPVVPESLGRYRLLERVGGGGFGVVYRAEDLQLHRTVALKVPRSLALIDNDSRDRFLREAKAAAGLHHPHIVALYDAGEANGICYLASAFVPGKTLGDWSASNGCVRPDDAALMVLALAGAVQHAHENNVLHRDIKPQNVLLDSSGSFQGLPFSPKLTDFSIAKVLDSDGDETMTGLLLGTPRYMAPELAAGMRNQLGPACDIYSLGVVLYELLTGRVPIEGEGHGDTLRRVISEEPVSPSRLSKAIPRDLEAICMRCLQKDLRRRYATAEDLASDLQRFLLRQPTIARPIRWPERLGRWVRRQPAAAGLICVSSIATILILGGLALHSRRLSELNDDLGGTNVALQHALLSAEDAEALARTNESKLQQSLYVSDMRLAGRAWRDGDLRGMTDLLKRHVPLPDEQDRRGIGWRFLANLAAVKSRTLDTLPTEIYQLRRSQNGRQLVAAGKDSIVRIYDTATGKLEHSIPTGQGEVNGVAFSAQGQQVVSAGDDGTVQIRNVADQSIELTIDAFSELAFYAVYTPDEELLITCGRDPEIRIWDAKTGRLTGVLTGNTDRVEAIAVSSDGKWVASAARDGWARVWDLQKREQVIRIRNHHPQSAMTGVAFSADSRTVVAVDRKHDLWVFDTVSYRLLAKGRHLDALSSVAVAPDGRMIATGDDVGGVCLWDLAAVRASIPKPGEPTAELNCVFQWQAHTRSINTMEFGSSRQLMTSGADGRIQLWQIPSATSASTLVEIDGVIDTVFSQDNFLLASRFQTEFMGWDPDEDFRLQNARLQPGRPNYMSSDQHGHRLATCSTDGLIEIWDPTAECETTPLTGHREMAWSLGEGCLPLAVCMSPDASALAILTSTPKTEIRVYDPRSGRLNHSFVWDDGTLNCVTFTSDSRRIAASFDDTVLIWNVADGRSVAESIDNAAYVLRIPETHTTLRCLAFSPDNAIIATGGRDRQIRLWDSRDGRLLNTLSGHLDSVESLTFAPNGRSLVSAGLSGVIKVWNVTAGQELLDLYADDDHHPSDLRFSPNGRWLTCIRGDHMRLLMLDFGNPLGIATGQ